LSGFAHNLALESSRRRHQPCQILSQSG